MARSLKDLRQVRAKHPPRLVLYGVHGIGKTTLAAEAPAPVFLQIEEGTPGDLELTSFGELKTFDDVLESFYALYQEEHPFKTVVIDTLDALEPLVWRKVCEENGWRSIEDAGYGKGYVAAEDVWQRFLDGVNALRVDKGMNTIQLAHSQIERFDSPISEPYHRYALKLHKRAAALIQEDADIVCFANYLISLKQTDVGFNKKRAHGESGGQRMLYFEERPGFAAKNRYGMPPAAIYKKGSGWTEIAKYCPAAAVAPRAKKAAAAKVESAQAAAE